MQVMKTLDNIWTNSSGPIITQKMVSIFVINVVTLIGSLPTWKLMSRWTTLTNQSELSTVLTVEKLVKVEMHLDYM